MGDDGLVELTAVIRRSLRSRTSDPHLVEDTTQETMLRVAAAQPNLEPGALRAYAIVTARNSFNAHLRNESIARRHAHRVVDYTTLDGAEALTLEREETDALAQALEVLDESDRRLLLDHEVDQVDVATLATRDDTSAGATAMRLPRRRRSMAAAHPGVVRSRPSHPSERVTAHKHSLPLLLFWRQPAA